jgi:hypothetical protein
MENQSQQESENNFKNFNFTPVKSKHVSKDSGGACVLTIVNTAGNGKRVAFATQLLEDIGSPESVQLSFDDRGIAIGSELPGNENSFKLKKIGKKGIVYSAALVDEITEHFGLDFTGKSSISFPELRLLNNGVTKVAFVPISQEQKPVDKEMIDHNDYDEELEH